MRILSNVLIINCLSILFLNAQTEKTPAIANNRFFVGIDFGKNITLLESESYSLDGEFKYKFDENFYFSLIGGYTHYQGPHQEQDIKNYQSKGGYLKPGIEVFTSRNWQAHRVGASFGFAGTLSNFSEKGLLTFKGDYFEDVIFPLNRPNLTSLGIDLSFNIWIKLVPRFYLNMGTRVNITSSPHIPTDLFEKNPVYYIPGVGNNTSKKEGLNILSGGITLRLLYGFQ